MLIVSDAWAPQVNGVVRTLRSLARELTGAGVWVDVIGPDRFRTLPCPTYPDIRLSVLPRRALRAMIDAARPDALHIATEGPLGIAARAIARGRGWRFTTAFHTRFPDYLRARTGVPTRWTYAWLRRFHGASDGVMVATESLRDELAGRGFCNLRLWSRGVDLQQFHGHGAEAWAGLSRPVFLSVGRVAVEKNIEAFLRLDLPGSKVVVGEGPMLATLRRAYPAVRFDGVRHGAGLASAYAGADVMVFPSRTDTFGLVLLESLACGTPVAAYPVAGPRDVLGGAPVGVLDEDLRAACLRALTVDRAACVRHAAGFSWRGCAERFLANLVPVASGARVGARAE